MEGARKALAVDAESVDRIRRDHIGSIEGTRGAQLLVDYEIPRERSAGWLVENLDAADRFVVVGTFDDVVFGYGLVSVEELAEGGTIGVIEEFITAAEIRKSGIGEAMMNLIVAELQERDCVGVDSRALPGDRETKNFFESFGLKARLLTVHRSL